jgi:hypothetical protein
MSYCSNCGAHTARDDKFCFKCGTPAKQPSFALVKEQQGSRRMDIKTSTLFLVLFFVWPAFPQAPAVKVIDGDLVTDSIPDTSARTHTAPHYIVQHAAVAKIVGSVGPQAASAVFKTTDGDLFTDSIPDTSARPRTVPQVAEKPVDTRSGSGKTEKKIPFRIGISAGIGYNQLFWIMHNSTVADCYRTAFDLTPEFRVSVQLHSGRKISIMPFIEYTIFGGQSAEDSTGYKDEYLLYAIGTGAIVNMHFNRFEAGIGAKINFIIKTTGYYYGTVRTEDQADWTNDFVRVCEDLGVRIGYSIGQFTLSNEEWFGITDLLHGTGFQSGRYGPGWSTAHEIHYRLYVTYNFPK